MLTDGKLATWRASSMLRAADAIDGTRCYISGSGTGGWGRIRCGCHDMDAIDETTFALSDRAKLVQFLLSIDEATPPIPIP